MTKIAKKLIRAHHLAEVILCTSCYKNPKVFTYVLHNIQWQSPKLRFFIFLLNSVKVYDSYISRGNDCQSLCPAYSKGQRCKREADFWQAESTKSY